MDLWIHRSCAMYREQGPSCSKQAHDKAGGSGRDESKMENNSPEAGQGTTTTDTRPRPDKTTISDEEEKRAKEAAATTALRTITTHWLNYDLAFIMIERFIIPQAICMFTSSPASHGAYARISADTS